MEQSKFYQIKNITEQEYTLVSCDGSVIALPIQDVEKSASAFTIKDAKDGDVLEFGDHGRLVTGILSFVNKTTGKVDVSCLLEGDKFKVGVFYNLDTVRPHPATKEQRALLFQKMHEAGYMWDSESKKPTREISGNEEKISPKWNEEDEENLRDIISAIQFIPYQTAEAEKERTDWLKSLKQRMEEMNYESEICK